MPNLLPTILKTVASGTSQNLDLAIELSLLPVLDYRTVCHKILSHVTLCHSSS